MPDFTVLAAQQKKTLDGRNGPMQVITLRLTDGTVEHDAEWFTKASTPIPDANSRIEGTLEASDYGLKFKKAFSGGPGGAPRARDPKETSAIVRQHSEHMAVLLLQVKATAGVLADGDLTPTKIRSLVDWFDDDVAAGVERKHPSPGMVKGLPVRNEPERTGAPDTVTPSPDYPAPEPVGSDVPFGDAA